MGRAWPALDIHLPGCDPVLHDLLLAELDDHQPTAIQDLFDEDTGQNQQLRVFFAAAGARDRAAQALREAFGSQVFVEPAEIDDEDWAARSQANLGPVTVGRITVSPPWLAAGSNAILIQPSMGFGTGHHATTRLMLGALQRLDLNGREVLDVGCGSGVLAIAAVLLGARSARGIDNDPDALAAAAENLQLNGVTDRVRLENADVGELTTPADVVLANLTGGLLARHAPTLARLVSPKGRLIVSGLMKSESTVLPALEEVLDLEETTQEDEWLCARFGKDSD